MLSTIPVAGIVSIIAVRAVACKQCCDQRGSDRGFCASTALWRVKGPVVRGCTYATVCSVFPLQTLEESELCGYHRVKTLNLRGTIGSLLRGDTMLSHLNPQLMHHCRYMARRS